MYASVVIGEEDVLAMDKPIIVVCVETGQVYTKAGDVPTFFAGKLLNRFAMFYPNAIARATAVPAGST
jgi:hypothetical protein